MQLTITLGLLAVFFAIAGGAAGMGMVSELRKRGIEANPLMIRWMLFKYAADYRRVTLEETGQIGPLYHLGGWLSAIAAMLAIGVILTFIF
jgi:hypothetical protein